MAKTSKRSGSKPKARPTGTAKSPVEKTRARTVAKQAGELLKKPLVREAVAAVVVTAMAKRSARKAAREEVREGAPANAGAALGSAVGTIAGEALRGLVSKPAKRPRDGNRRAGELEPSRRRAQPSARPQEMLPKRAPALRLAPQAAGKKQSRQGLMPQGSLVRLQKRRPRKPSKIWRRGFSTWLPQMRRGRAPSQAPVPSVL